MTIKNDITNLKPIDRVNIARDINRPGTQDFIKTLFTGFFEQKGDHLYDDDSSIIGGIAFFKGTPVTVLGNRKGHDINERIKNNFGMPKPEGYRKTLRIMKQAEKFNRPIIIFIDTPGAYPGVEAEEHGQAEAIARNMASMLELPVPIISIVTGEANSGGALALSVADVIIMLENAVYSILSPEGFATIMWKGSSKKNEACELMKMTAFDLKDDGIVDEVINETINSHVLDVEKLYNDVGESINQNLRKLQSSTLDCMLQSRYIKYRLIGS